MTRTIWMAALSVALFGSFPIFSSAGGPSPQRSDHDERPSPSRAEIPFELFNDHLIVVKGTIGSIENVNIVLDTGSSPTAISRDTADQLSLRGNPQSLLMSNGSIDVQGAVLSSIQIGAFHAQLLRVIVQDLRFMQHKLGIPIGGIAGLDVLSTASFMIDYQKRRIVFEPMEATRKAVPFATRLPFLTIKAKIKGQEVRLLVDSGTSALLIYRTRLKTKLEQLSPERDPQLSTSAGAISTRWCRASDVSLGRQSLGPQIMLIADVDPDPRYEFDGLLGFNTLGFQKVWLDFENGLFGWE